MLHPLLAGSWGGAAVLLLVLLLCMLLLLLCILRLLRLLRLPDLLRLPALLLRGVVTCGLLCCSCRLTGGLARA
jgi:hypothetical protein